MTIDDYIELPHGGFVKYSNIVKNSVKLKQTPWGEFFIKKYHSVENNEDDYSYISVKIDIFKLPIILPYSIKFNPEKLI